MGMAASGVGVTARAVGVDVGMANLRRARRLPQATTSNPTNIRPAISGKSFLKVIAFLLPALTVVG